MRDHDEQTRAALVRARIDFQHLRALAEQLVEIGMHSWEDAPFLLAQRITTEAEASISIELGRLDKLTAEVTHG